jgi:ubiquitin carboxyl-terminal hydrolase 10
MCILSIIPCFAVQYNNNILIFTEFLSSNLRKLVQKNGKPLYKLCAVTYHNGTQATNGHYIADGFHVQHNWLRYNDNIVKCISEDDVLKPKSPSVPYLLYYKRCAAIAH